MFRINLIKSILFLAFALLLLGQGVLAAKDLLVLNSSNEPVLHALVQIGGKKPISVNELGRIDLSSQDAKAKVLIFAMGYETETLTVQECQNLEQIVLKSKESALDEIVVSATRTDRSVEDLPMPVTVLSQEKIRQTGGIRLSDVLREQTGLQITSEHGSGLQMQGLDSDYILILLDGEPLIGRTAGTFDLDRISVSNIERIEILRGPSSAIYGSEAMAGVINIITKASEAPKTATVGLRHRSFNSWNPFLEAGINRDRWSVDLLYDYFQTDGFDLNPEVLGQTQNPYQAQTAQVKVKGQLSDKIELSLFGRGYLEDATGIQAISSGAASEEVINLNNELRDWNFNPTLRFKPNENWLFSLRGMSSWYRTLAESRFQGTGEEFDLQDFNQFYHRTELQTDFQADEKNLLTLGMGHIVETVEATRYEGVNRFDAAYLFLQHQWNPKEKINVVSGLRADLHSEYGGRLSPKISAQYKISEKFSAQASIGSGFKAPDFRQLLLNFNNAAAGYYVFGSTLAEEGLARLQSQGLVSQILIEPETLGELEAETSWAVNTGFRWNPSPRLGIQVNGFRNQIENLIETAPIARLTSGQNAFSYFNIQSVITQGVEVDLNYTFRENIRFSAGYAFLDTRDRDVLDGIDLGEYFKRNDQNITSQVTRSDYGGLFNRSRHSGNIKLSYRETRSGINFSLRGIYRGRFGFGDLNGNLILDDDSEYADGWMSVNFTAAKTFSNGILLELGGTNLLNTSTPNQPNNPGRMLFAGIQVPIFKN